jgi:prepilin-type N-terminal cleavage/methylation domain-containing protein
VRKNNCSGFSLIELTIVTVILGVVLAIVTQILGSVQRSYTSQQQRIQAQENARVALDQMVRLIRMAGNDPSEINFQAIDPDPDANSSFDSVRIRADWNPGDGVLDDRYEDVIFKTNGSKVYTREPSDAADVEFVDNVGSMAFSYFDANNTAIANPVASAGLIAYVQITIQTQAAGATPMTLRSGAAIRIRERQ